jgi:hypothetical protein
MSPVKWVEILHRDDLRIARAGGALDAKTGDEGLAHALCQRDRVVVLPSPAFVGVMAVTMICRRACRSSTDAGPSP